MYASLIDVMGDLMEEKNGLVRENLNNITKANNDILNNLSNQMKEKKLNAVDDWAERERLTSERAEGRTTPTALPS
jgi:hypothetical protein